MRLFQELVGKWMAKCFIKALYGNMTERGDRLLEETLELLQSGGYDRTRIPTLVDYVYGRPPGEPGQEVGGVMITLAAYCEIAKLQMGKEAWAELRRINEPEIMERIRLKQANKNNIHDPLPGGAAQGAVAEVVETRCGCHPETCCCGDYTLKINGSYAACGSKERMHRIADAVNATHPQAAPAQGDGMVLVPVNATEEMRSAFAIAMGDTRILGAKEQFRIAYAKLLAAAPSQESKP